MRKLPDRTMSAGLLTAIVAMLSVNLTPAMSASTAPASAEFGTYKWWKLLMPPKLRADRCGRFPSASCRA